MTHESWPRRKERLLRNALIADPHAAADYATLKRQLAAAHPDDMAAYTHAKTAFVQRIIDRVHDIKGWQREDVWEE